MPIISKVTLPDNTTYDLTDGRGMFVGQCSTTAATQIKDVSVSADQNFVLRIGAVIAVKFTYSNTYKSTTSAPCKMNVNGTGAKNIYWVNTATPDNTTSTIAFGKAGYYHFYLYDGSNWVWVGYSNESNTTYSGMTVAEIEAGTSTTNRLISPVNLKTAIQTWAPTETLYESLGSVINAEAKNLSKVRNASSTLPTRWVDILISVEPGLYTVYFGNLSSTDTDTNLSQAIFLDDDNQNASAWMMFTRGEKTAVNVEVTAATKTLRVYPSNSYAASEGDVVTVTDIMICKQEHYNVSQEYVPYIPSNEELYQMILDLQAS